MVQNCDDIFNFIRFDNNGTVCQLAFQIVPNQPRTASTLNNRAKIRSNSTYMRSNDVLGEEPADLISVKLRWKLSQRIARRYQGASVREMDVD